MSQDESKTTVGDNHEEEEEGPISMSVIIDNGSDSIKIGFAGDDFPRTILSNKFGYTGIEREHNYNNKKNGVLSVTYPIEHGVVTSWDDIEKIWHHTFYNELRIEPDDSNVLLTSLNSSKDNYRMTEMMFEEFNVNGIFICTEAALSLYANGKKTGTVIDCGFDVTQVVPIIEGEITPHATSRLDVGGYDLTDYLMKRLCKRCDNSLVESSDRARTIARDIKERYGYVAKDFDHEKEIENNIEKSYKLPDGQVILIGDERFECPEVLFKPSLIGKKSQGIDKLTFDSIMKCDVDIRNYLFKSVILTGGTTMFPGFKQRLKNEIEKLTPSSVPNVSIIASPERDVCAFVGGSILCSLRCFAKQWITRDQYDERVCRQPLRGNCTSVRYSNGNNGDNGGDSIILKGNVSSTRCIY